MPARPGDPLTAAVDRSTSRRSTRRQPARSTSRASKIYPKRVARPLPHGSNGSCMAVTLGIYYLTPWLRWDRGPLRARPGGAGRSRQPPLLLLLHRDLAAGILLHRRPADHGRRSALFLVTSLVGRVWCGYTCPQTVWTDLFICRRAADRGRPQRPHASSTRRPGASSKIAQARRQARRSGCSSPSPPAAPGSSISPTRRRCCASSSPARRRRSPTSPSAS